MLEKNIKLVPNKIISKYDKGLESMPLFSLKSMTTCHDCDAKPGEPHKKNCDTERCSVCGGQRLCCDCKGHDKYFAKWTGIWPGKAEADYLGIDLNEFMQQELYKIFFIKGK